MMNTLELINAAVAQGNTIHQQELTQKNTEYLKSFERNNREKEYQAYVSSLQEIENNMPKLG